MNNFYNVPIEKNLADHVERFWVLHSPANPGLSTYYASAGSTLKLVAVFSVGADRLKFIHASLHGQSQKFGQYPFPNGTVIVGIHLMPHASSKIFGLPPEALQEKMTDLRSCLKGVQLHDQLTDVRSEKDAVSAITDFIYDSITVDQLLVDHRVINAARIVKETNGNANLGQLAASAYLSAKQFERKFKEAMGYYPKLYSRIIRFESVRDNYDSRRSLTDAAYEHGFYDQAHLIRDFKTFSGFTPRRYFLLRRS
jgi:AraC-like DNA-binding protein